MKPEEINRQAQEIFNKYNLTPYDLVMIAELSSLNHWDGVRDTIEEISSPPSTFMIEKLDTRVEDVGFSTRISRILKDKEIETFAQITRRSKRYFLKIKGLGNDSVDEIEYKLSIRDLSFGMTRLNFWYDKINDKA